MKKKKIAWTIVILLTLLTLQLVWGLGVIPAKTNVDLSDSNTYEGKITIVNNDHLKMEIKLSAEDNLQGYFSFSEDSFKMQKNDEEKSIDFLVNLPPGLTPEGMISSIIITQEIKNNKKIEAAVSLKHKLLLKGPIPEKYVKTRVYSQINGDKLGLVSELSNLGKVDLEKVKTTFYVTSNIGQELNAETDETSLSVGETKNLDAQISLVELGEGEFDILAVTQFAGEETKTQQKINLGEKNLVVVDLNRIFQAHDFNEFNLKLRNTWNKEAKAVAANLELSKDGKVLTSFKTASVDIPALGEKIVQQYFDAQEIDEGDYLLKIIKYEGLEKLSEEEFSVKFVNDEEYQRSTADLITGGISSSPEKTTPISALLVPSLLLIILVLMLIHRKIDRRNKEKRDGFGLDD